MMPPVFGRLCAITFRSTATRSADRCFTHHMLRSTQMIAITGCIAEPMTEFEGRLRAVLGGTRALADMPSGVSDA